MLKWIFKVSQLMRQGKAKALYMNIHDLSGGSTGRTIKKCLLFLLETYIYFVLYSPHNIITGLSNGVLHPGFHLG